MREGTDYSIGKADRDIAIAGALAIFMFGGLALAGYQAGKDAARKAEIAPLCEISETDGSVAATELDDDTGELVVTSVLLPSTNEIVSVASKYPCRYLNRKAAA